MAEQTDFFKKCKLPILWTIGYVFVLWAVLHILFNFELFSQYDWIRVSQAHLRGFAGFTFSLILLTAIPLYIATMAIIIRTQKPLLAIPAPNFITKIMEKLFSKPTPEPEPQPEQNESVQMPTNQEQDKFPAEMRGAFIRARTHPNRITAPICSVCSVTPNIYPDNASNTPSAPTTPESEIPLPPEFDFDTPAPMGNSTPSAPVFQDINFYDDNDSTESKYTDNNPVTEHLIKTNREFNILDNGIILTQDLAIITHTDSDFWIMDEPTWFASGKTRESPIQTLIDASIQHKVQPILYMGATNIMNFQEKRAEWESKGIRVITDLTDL